MTNPPAHNDHRPAQRSLLPGRQVSGPVKHIERRGYSINGNPVWLLYVETGGTTRHGTPAAEAFLTARDSSVAYEMSHSWEGRRVTLVLNGSGRIIDADLTPA